MNLENLSTIKIEFGDQQLSQATTPTLISQGKGSLIHAYDVFSRQNEAVRKLLQRPRLKTVCLHFNKPYISPAIILPNAAPEEGKVLERNNQSTSTLMSSLQDLQLIVCVGNIIPSG